MRCRTRVPCILPFASLLILLAGCGRHGSFTVIVSPDRGPAATVDARTDAQAASDQLQGNSGFFPLTIGNHWQYARTESAVIVPMGSEAQPPIVVRSQTDARLVGTQTLSGRDYVIEKDVISKEGQASWTQFLYWRQDRTGLFEAEIATTDLVAGDRGAVAAAVTRALSRVEDVSPAARAAWSAARQGLERKLALLERLARGLGARPADDGAVVIAEMTFLFYPLHPGASWNIRTDLDPWDPVFTLRVEGMDQLSTPAGRFSGWRMRLDVGGFGPTDVTHVWYGHDGYLGLKAHVERVAYDENGNPIGTMVVELTEWLDEIDLVKPGRGVF